MGGVTHLGEPEALEFLSGEHPHLQTAKVSTAHQAWGSERWRVATLNDDKHYNFLITK
jgi:hypothetical protein